MRTFSAAALTAIQSGTVPLSVLIEMDLSTPLLMNTSVLNLTVGASTYLGVGLVGTIEPVSDSPAEIKPLQFQLSGAPSAQISLALQEPVQGKAVRLKLAIYDPATYALIEADQIWAGLLDVMSIEDGEKTATISVSAEHAGIDLLRPIVSLYDNAEQQRLFPGDLFWQFNADQVEMRIVWPTAAFFRQE
jgi:hypothetical protein